MYVIRKGKVKILDHKGAELSTLQEGSCFNDLSFVFDSIILHTAIAEDFCILDILYKEDYVDLLQGMPNLQRDLKKSIKDNKFNETNEIVVNLQKTPFFSDFTADELKVLYREYLDVLYLNPDTLVTGPTSKCNALYFVSQGTVHRFKKSEQSYEYIKMRILEDEEELKDHVDTFVQQIDILEKKKRLEDTKPDQILVKGDWMGSRCCNS